MDSLPFAEFALLYIGLGIFLIIFLGVVLPNTMPTPRGRLNRQRRELKHRLFERQQAEKTVAKAKRDFAKLQGRAKEVQPKLLREAEGHADDMQQMLVHASDKVLVAENHVRRILLDEFPPAVHQQLLEKYSLQ
jgi:signal transduction histidine kinase